MKRSAKEGKAGCRGWRWTRHLRHPWGWCCLWRGLYFVLYLGNLVWFPNPLAPRWHPDTCQLGNPSRRLLYLVLSFEGSVKCIWCLEDCCSKGGLNFGLKWNCHGGRTIWDYKWIGGYKGMQDPLTTGLLVDIKYPTRPNTLATSLAKMTNIKFRANHPTKCLTYFRLPKL